MILTSDKGGWLHEETIGYFRDFAETCFKEFGEKASSSATIKL